MPKREPDEICPRMKRKEYEKELRSLQTELCRLQDWVVHAGSRIVVVVEGRDAAGKSGMIKALTDRVSPRVFRLVALPAPSDRERTQIYIQRYLQQFPAAGEVVIFDRSWYNRAGVEYVMGFCTKDQYRREIGGSSFFAPEKRTATNFLPGKIELTPFIDRHHLLIRQ